MMRLRGDGGVDEGEVRPAGLMWQVEARWWTGEGGQDEVGVGRRRCVEWCSFPGLQSQHRRCGCSLVVDVEGREDQASERRGCRQGMGRGWARRGNPIFILGSFGGADTRRYFWNERESKSQVQNDGRKSLSLQIVMGHGICVGEWKLTSMQLKISFLVRVKIKSLPVVGGQGKIAKGASGRWGESVRGQGQDAWPKSQRELAAVRQ